MPQGAVYKVVGGAGDGGIIVRQKKQLSSEQLPERLATGATVRVIFQDDESGRLRYQLLTGAGPSTGWVSIRVQGREMLVRGGESSPEGSEKENSQPAPPKKAPAPKQPRRPEPPRSVARPPSGYPMPLQAASGQVRATAVPVARGACPPRNLYRVAIKGSQKQGLPLAASFQAPMMMALPEGELDPYAVRDSDGEEMQLCPKCNLPVGDVCYFGKGKELLHGECKAKALLTEAREDEEARQRQAATLKRREREKYSIGWKAEAVPRNEAPAGMLQCTLATGFQGLCCVALQGGSSPSVRVLPTADPAAAVNLEYLSLALRVRMQEGREPLFSLDAKDVPKRPSGEAQDLWQVKRFEPPWLGGTSVGEVMFQADYHLKELSMGECQQPVVGMRSCFDFSKEDWNELDWRAREWFVVNKAEIRMSKGNVLIPQVKMGVEAREQIRTEDGFEDAVITRKDHPLVRYAEAFTDNFELIAERKSCIYHLRELAKASVLAKYLLDSKVELEDNWLNLAQEVRELYRLEIPQLWNQRCFSQVRVQDGRIVDGEKGVGMGLQGVYGGVQFGLDKFDLGATTMQPGAGEAPYSLLFSAADRGAVMARGVVTPPSLMEPRGVDLCLDKFDLLQTVPEDMEAEAGLALGSGFWTALDGEAKGALKEQDKSLLRAVFNAHISDRRDEGDRFVPPDARAGQLETLRELVRKETGMRQSRKDHFFGKAFALGNPGPLFPSTWASHFALPCDAVPAPSLAPVDAEPAALKRALATAPAFDRTAEDGARFRVYRCEGLEVRTVQEHGGEEVAGAVFSTSAASLGRTPGQGPAVKESDRIAKALEYVEAGPSGRCHFYAVLETESGAAVVTEMLKDGTVAWVENPQDLEARNGLAAVYRATESCAETATVRELLQRHSEAQLAPGAAVSASARKRYAHGAYLQAAGPQVAAN